MTKVKKQKNRIQASRFYPYGTHAFNQRRYAFMNEQAASVTSSEMESESLSASGGALEVGLVSSKPKESTQEQSSIFEVVVALLDLSQSAEKPTNSSPKQPGSR